MGFFLSIFDIISHVNAFFSAIILCFFSLVTLRLSMAKSKISLGKCHTALENICTILYDSYLLSLFDYLTLLRLSMAKSKISLGKCHVVLENMWDTFKYALIWISKQIPQW